MRTKHFLTLFFLLSTYPLCLAQVNNGVIKSKIVDVQNNNPIPFCNIKINNLDISGKSDFDGIIQFNTVPPGYQSITVSADGYTPYISDEILIINSQETYIEIRLEKIPLNIQEVTIRPNVFVKRPESPLAFRSIPIKEIEQNPGGNRDISKVIQSYPGVASTVSGFRNDLIVRGGGPSENRYYLDDIEIPNINHFATQGASGGPVGILNIDFIRQVDFYSGGFPSNRGNAISSVLNFKQKDGNSEAMNYRVAIGSSDLSLSAEGPLSEKTTGLFSYRRSYLQVLFSFLDLPFLPTYNDAQFKIKTKIDAKNELTFIGLGSLDNMELNLDANEDEDQQFILDYLPTIEQFSYTLGVRYKHFRENSYDTWVISTNRFDNRETKYLNNIEEDENLIRNYNSWEMETKLRYEFNFATNSGLKINVGSGVENAQYFNETFRLDYDNETTTPINYKSKITFWKYALFGQASQKMMEQRLALTLGLRLDGNSFAKKMRNPFNQFAPRFSAQYKISNQWNANFSLGKYTQLPTYTMMGYRDENDELINRNNGIRYIQNKQIGGGVDFAPNEESFFSLEGFFKDYSDYPFSVADSVSMASKGTDYGSFGDEEILSNNEGRSYGFEISARVQDLLGFNTNLSYTWVRSEFSDNKGNFIPSAWDNKNLVTLTLLKEFNQNWDIGFKFRYLGGGPFTPYDLEKSSEKEAWDAQGRGYLDYSKYNTERLDAYHQLDLRVDKSWYYPTWTLHLYFDIQNIYSQTADSPDELTLVRDGNGIPVTDPTDSNKYVLKTLETSDSSFLPSIGFLIDF